MKKAVGMGIVGLCLLAVFASCKEREDKLAALKKQERSSEIWDKLKEQMSLRIEVFGIPTYYTDMWSRETPCDTVIYSYRRSWHLLGGGYQDYNLESYNYTLDSLREDGLVRIEFIENSIYLIFRERSDTWKILTEGGWKWGMDIQSSKAKIPFDAIKGDFNGDGVVDYVWCEFFEDHPEGDTGETIIRFSGNFPTLSFDGYVWGTVDNLGDLNNDGADEMGLFPCWPTSVFHNYHVYSFKEKDWECILTIPYNKNFMVDDTPSRYQAHADQPPVTKHKTKKGYFIVKSNGWDENDEGFSYWYLKTDTIKLKLK